MMLFFLRALQSFVAAIMLMTRLPVEHLPGVKQLMSPWPEISTRQGPFWHPLIGLGIGGVQAGAFWVVFHVCDLSQAIAAGAAVLVHVFITGALHEDGLADCADGLFGGGTPERRLEIMTDSRVGSYGALALIFGMGFCWLFLSSLPVENVPALLMATAVLSRSLNGIALRWGTPARPKGLAARQGRPHAFVAVLSLTFGSCIALLFNISYNGLTIFGCGLTAWLIAYLWGTQRIGGYTGDILGGAQQMSALGTLLAATVIYGH